MRNRTTTPLALAAVLFALAGCGQTRPASPEARMAQASRDGLGPGGAMVDLLEKGDRKARVRIEAYYPLNQEHKPIADLLLGFPDKYPGQVYLRLADWRTERGKKLWYASGLTCGGIQINGKSEILLEGRKQPTLFLQAIDVYWTREELEAAVRQAVRAAYPPPSGRGETSPPAGPVSPGE